MKDTLTKSEQKELDAIHEEIRELKLEFIDNLSKNPHVQKHMSFDALETFKDSFLAIEEELH